MVNSRENIKFVLVRLLADRIGADTRFLPCDLKFQGYEPAGEGMVAVYTLFYIEHVQGVVYTKEFRLNVDAEPEAVLIASIQAAQQACEWFGEASAEETEWYTEEIP